MNAALVMGMKTYGAVKLSDLREMPVMMMLRTVREFEKLVKGSSDG